MKTIVNPQDYDSYKILLPAGKIFGRGKKNYIYQELEKRHPCFSESFAFDTKTVLSRKGFICNVTVMDKNILGRYKSEFPESRLLVEENRTVFGKKKYIFCFIVFLGMVLTLCSVLEFRKQEATEINQTVEITAPIEKPYMSIAENLFMDISENDGEIISLNWSFDGFSESLSMDLKNCVPQDFDYSATVMNIRFSPVKFEKSIPFFTLNADQNASGILQTKNQENRRKEFFEDMNTWLSENGFLLKGEDYSEGIFYLNYSQDFSKKVYELSGKLEEIKENFGFSLKGVKIDSPEMELYFSDQIKLPDEKNIFGIMAETGPALYQKTQPKKVLSSDKKTHSVKAENRRKIGTIVHGNGEKTVFYKNNKGKIENDE